MSEPKLAHARATLEATPVRAVTMLRGIGRSLVIRATLLKLGFTSADRRRRLVAAPRLLWARRRQRRRGQPDRGRRRHCRVDAWDERGFALVQASITHRHPPQASFLMANLAATEGPDAVLGIARLLDRLGALEHDPLREETREDGHAALDVLAKRGLGADERARLRALVAKVEQATGHGAENTRTVEGEEIARLTRLRAWYDEWAELCRAVLRRPEHLERVGLAGRRAECVST